jgi:hypothetical protein
VRPRGVLGAQAIVLDVKEQRRERIRREVGERRERGEKRGCRLILRERERGERIRMTAWRDTERLKFQNLFAGGSMERIFPPCAYPLIWCRPF